MEATPAPPPRQHRGTPPGLRDRLPGGRCLEVKEPGL
ncbi:hypothetical protein Nmel_016608 [Mimus melanotis]